MAYAQLQSNFMHILMFDEHLLASYWPNLNKRISSDQHAKCEEDAYCPANIS